MAFSDAERAVLLAVKGVGPTVVLRLEQMGISTLKDLSTHTAEGICAAQAAALGASCWKNSPQARAAIAAAIEAATAHAGRVPARSPRTSSTPSRMRKK